MEPAGSLPKDPMLLKPELPPRKVGNNQVKLPLNDPRPPSSQEITSAERLDIPAESRAIEALGLVPPPLPRRLTPNQGEIDLSDSTIEQRFTVFEHVRPNAKTLNLSHCRNLMVNFLTFPNLEKLDLSFSKITPMRTCLEELKKLNHLTLSESSFDLNDLKVPESLKTLVLISVNLTEKHLAKIVQMNGLETLVIKNCQVDMTQFEMLKHSTLKLIEVDGKQIETKGKLIEFNSDAIIKVNKETGTIEIKGRLIEINGKIYLNVD